MRGTQPFDIWRNIHIHDKAKKSVFFSYFHFHFLNIHINDNIANLFLSLLFILSLPHCEQCFDIISFCEVICVWIELWLHRNKSSKDQPQNITKVRTKMFRGRENIFSDGRCHYVLIWLLVLNLCDIKRGFEKTNSNAVQCVNVTSVTLCVPQCQNLEAAHKVRPAEGNLKPNMSKLYYRCKQHLVTM